MPVISHCQRCDREISHKPSRKPKYCSKACKDASRRTIQPKACIHCGTEFRSKHKTAKYCSIKCRDDYRIAQAMVNCEQCGKEFYRVPGHVARENHTYCSKACRGLAQRGENNHQWKGGLVDLSCFTCGDLFQVKPGRAHKQRYCSQKCRGHKLAGPRVQRIAKQCPECDRSFEVTPAKADQKYCSKECTCNYISKPCVECGTIIEKVRPSQVERKLYCSVNCRVKGQAKKISGEGNGRYIHGQAEDGYGPHFPPSLREAVRDRDGRRCVLCSMGEDEHGSLLPVHHIDYDKANGSMDNLITLCRFCHGQCHGLPESRERWKQELSRLLEERNAAISLSTTLPLPIIITSLKAS